ncbi:cytidine deaminase [Terriglobus saanensis]|uniref:Cytidine deaminase n=1 Tax=Terriglobus saanensis (strain ATCC BAA-1853 / DSM 23119 / SP1PR4) TaxID=401053 RepID=E8V4T9_TERSS|nr:cytidine deaminase [Terriglobus saanensis]ADV81493.1 cytidine deaminase [Terriglobus saanensis SP1PR4]
MSALSPDQTAALLAAAKAAADYAYAPYSNFHVGAAILLTTGETVTGCNVENASYRLTTCAEQTAIVHAVAQLGPQIKIAAVAIANTDPTVACMPCGACRQTILEFAAETCQIFYPGENGVATNATLDQLLPASFHFKK